MASTRNNIHRQQLFHWIGKGIEKQSSGTRRKLNDAQREEYVSHLRKSIESGLWMTKPSAEQVTVGNQSFLQNLPVTCFTEWSLDRSKPHTLRYGRLGLGFPKNIILIKGGQPVSYFKSTGPRRLYAAAMVDLLRYFEAALLQNGTVRRGSGTPPYLIPYKPGVELFTVALPDNRTVKIVLQEKFFLRELFGPNRPHVMVVSIQDVGAF